MVRINSKYLWEKVEPNDFGSNETWKLELFGWDGFDSGGKLYQDLERESLPFISRLKDKESPIRRIEISHYNSCLITDISQNPKGLAAKIGLILPGGSLALPPRKKHLYKRKIDSYLTFWDSDGFDTWKVIEGFFLKGNFKEGQDFSQGFITEGLDSFKKHLTKRFEPFGSGVNFGDYLGTFLINSNLPTKYRDIFKDLIKD